MIYCSPIRSRPGFLLIEAILGIAIFGMFISAVGYTLAHGQEGTIRAGERIRAVYLSESALDVVRSIRDTDFDLLTEGTHGYALDESGTWTLTGSALTSSGDYLTSIIITPLESSLLRVDAHTTWKHGYVQSGSVMLTTVVGDWRRSGGVGDWSSISLEGSYEDGGTPLFNDGVVSGNHLFVTSEVSDGGDGLYVFSLASTNPSRIASGFDLTYAGRDIGVLGSRLYVLAEDESAEIRVYDVADPATFSSDDLITSYNLPGNARARGLTIDGTTLFVTAAESSTSGEHEFYVFDISSGESVTLLDSLDYAATVNGVAISGTSALLATSDNGVELVVASIENPSSVSIVSGESINITDVQDALGVAFSGTGVFVARESGEAIEELLKIFASTGGGIPSGQTPLYHELGGSAFAVATEPSGCYVFVSSDASSKEFQVVNAADSVLSEETYYDLSTGAGRGLTYSTDKNRVFVFTNSAVHVFRSADGATSCQ